MPSRWFAGGSGLDEFRAKMIDDRRLRAIVDNPKLFDCFPGVEIKGGINYFLWDRDYDGDCEFSTRIDGPIVSTMTRDLRGGDGVLIRDNRAVAILERVRAAFEDASVEKLCAPLKYFGVQMMTNYPGSVSEPFRRRIPLIYNSHVGYSRPTRSSATMQRSTAGRSLFRGPVTATGAKSPTCLANLLHWLLGQPAPCPTWSPACSTPAKRPRTTPTTWRRSSSGSSCSSARSPRT